MKGRDCYSAAVDAGDRPKRTRAMKLLSVREASLQGSVTAASNWPESKGRLAHVNLTASGGKKPSEIEGRSLEGVNLSHPFHVRRAHPKHDCSRPN